MASITESQTILIQDIIAYARNGCPILVKTPDLLVSVRKIESFISWVVVYRGKKHSIISCLNEPDYVNYLIFKFIKSVDVELG